jgi:hypothetical protein
MTTTFVKKFGNTKAAAAFERSNKKHITVNRHGCTVEMTAEIHQSQYQLNLNDGWRHKSAQVA